MKIAVIETGGKQYLVTEGAKIRVEKMPENKAGDKVSFDKVLLTDDGTLKLGAPYISGAKVAGTNDKEGRGKKIVVVKYQAKSRYYKKRGHRQPFADVTVTSL